MAEHYGDIWSEKPGLIIPARQSFRWRDLVGQGSPLYTKSLQFENATFDRDSDAYMLANGVLQKFDSDVPAIAEIGGRQCVQIERAFDTINTYTKPESGWATLYNLTPVYENRIGPLGTADMCDLNENTTSSTNFYADKTFAATSGYSYTASVVIKSKERVQARLTASGAFNTGGVWIDLASGALSTYGNGPNWSYSEVLSDGSIFVAMNVTATSSGGASIAINIAYDDSVTYNGVVGNGISVCYFNIVNIAYYNSYMAAGSSPGAKAADELEWSESQVAAEEWVRDRFAITAYPNFSSDQINENHQLFCFNDSGGDVYGYLNSNAELRLTGPSGTIINIGPLVWEAFKKLVITIEADDGSNCRVSIFGANVGGEFTGTSFSTTNGTLEIGARNHDNQFDGFLSEPYRY